MEDKAKEFVNAICAMGEVLTVMRESLMDNGFTRQEAVQMCSDYLVQMLTGGGKNGQA